MRPSNSQFRRFIRQKCLEQPFPVIQLLSQLGIPISIVSHHDDLTISKLLFQKVDWGRVAAMLF